jgi:hypothetical protein
MAPERKRGGSRHPRKAPTKGTPTVRGGKRDAQPSMKVRGATPLRAAIQPALAGYALVFAIHVVLAAGCQPPGAEVAGCASHGALGGCCRQDAPACDAGLVCVGGEGERGLCLEPCADGQGCSGDTVCLDSGDGTRVCAAAAGTVGAVCTVAADCRPGLVCLQQGGSGACTAECSAEEPCPPRERVGARVCATLSEGAGAYCVRPCSNAADCAPPLACTPFAQTPEFSVCFP